MLRLYADGLDENLHKANLSSNPMVQRQMRFPRESIDHFADESVRFYPQMSVKMINDRLVGLEQCFVNQRGISPKKPYARHVIFGTSKGNSYSGDYFPGVFDSLQKARGGAKAKAVKELCFQISSVQYCIECATNLLKPFV